MDRENIQAIFPPNGSQQALLYYALNPDIADPGLIQVRFRIAGRLDEQGFERAWNQVIARHDALRMSVQVPKGHNPMLVVAKRATLAMTVIDLRGQSVADQRARVDQCVARDAATRLVLSDPNVMRLTILKRADDLRDIVWTCHHLFLDGWSSTVVLRDVMAFYQALKQNTVPEVPAVPSYRAYLGWVQNQPTQTAVDFWTGYFKDAQRCQGRLPGVQSPKMAAGESGGVSGEVALPLNLSWDKIERAAAELRVTPASVITAAWAILLGTVTGSRDVVFGTSISGRSFDLPGREAMAGCFSGVIPKRCMLDSDVEALVQRVHADTFAVQPHEYLPLGDIQLCARTGGGTAVFDTLLVFENLPWRDIDLPVDGGLQLLNYSSDVTTTYPLTAIVIPGDDLKIRFVADARLDQAKVDAVLARFPALLARLCEERSGLMDAVLPHGQIADATPETPVLKTEQIDYAAKRAKTQTQLGVTKIWQNVLGLSELDIDQDFVTLGGRSFDVIRLLTQIEAQFGKRIALVDFIRDPTIANLSELLDSDAPPRQPWQSLVPIQPLGTAPPLAFMHVGGGHVVFLQALAKRLGTDQPVFGFQPPGLEGETPPLRSFEDLAALYVKELISVQPEGPYYLVGHCGGARLALEMAHMLQAQGAEIARFIVIDTHAPARDSAEAIPADGGKRVGLHLEKLRRGRVDLVAKTMFRVAARPLRRRGIDTFGSPDMRRREILRGVEKICTIADGAYVGRPFKGKITLLRSADMMHLPIDWSPFCDEVEQLDLPVRHENIFFEPDVAVLAMTLQRIVSDSPSRDVSEILKQGA